MPLLKSPIIPALIKEPIHGVKRTEPAMPALTYIRTLPKYFYRVIHRSRPCAVARLPICHVRQSPSFIETPMGDWLRLNTHPWRIGLLGNLRSRSRLEISVSSDGRAQ
jgi:hypothetical protein